MKFEDVEAVVSLVDFRADDVFLAVVHGVCLDVLRFRLAHCNGGSQIPEINQKGGEECVVRGADQEDTSGVGFRAG